MRIDPNEFANRFSAGVLATFVGGSYEFYGIGNRTFCIGVNGARMVLEAIEISWDGRHSYFDCFRVQEVGMAFFRDPIAKVKFEVGGLSTMTAVCRSCVERGVPDTGSPCSKCVYEKTKNFSGWVLRDVETDHAWLTIGTDYGEDDYPRFAFRYEPIPFSKAEVTNDA